MTNDLVLWMEKETKFIAYNSFVVLLNGPINTYMTEASTLKFTRANTHEMAHLSWDRTRINSHMVSTDDILVYRQLNGVSPFIIEFGNKVVEMNACDLHTNQLNNDFINRLTREIKETRINRMEMHLRELCYQNSKNYFFQKSSECNVLCECNLAMHVWK